MFFTVLGLLGVAINLVAYGLLTTGRLRADEVRYQLMNAVGTTGMLLSLIAQWNLPVFLVNVAWLTISFIGITRILLRNKRSKA